MKDYGELPVFSAVFKFMLIFLIPTCSDRNILLAAGLQPYDLPAHLNPEPRTSSSEPLPNIINQPDDLDCHTDMTQYYQDDAPNGHKPLQLAEIVAIQVRTNPKSDEDPKIFGSNVWETLDSDTKTKLQQAAKENPPNSASIGDTLYTPIRNILSKAPYDVPTPILDTFTALKAHEMAVWVIKLQN